MDKPLRPGSGSGRPSTLPERPSTRPGTRPGTGDKLPGKPGLPNIGDKLPGNPDRPGIGNPDRPGIGNPDRPGIGNPDRPGIGNPDRPGIGNPDRPGIGNPDRPGIGNPDRPGIGNPDRPGIGNPDRPGMGDRFPELGDKLPGNPDRPGIGDRFPELGDKLPGNPDRPGIGDRFPELGDKLPGNPDRPGIGDRFPGLGDKIPGRPDRPNRPGNNRPGRRPNIDIGDIQIGDNNVINNRPTWANIDRNSINQINNRWSNRLPSMNNWSSRYPGRFDSWHRWGNNIRGGWGRYPGYFGPSWWAGRSCAFGAFSYCYAFNSYPSNYWWSTPTYASCTNFFTWSAPATAWQEPIYYDYSSGGNVTYENNQVYIGGEQVASADEFAASAADLATVPAPADDTQAEEMEWMALGTFAVSTDPDDIDPTRFVQLAVNQEGIVSGTLYNNVTDKTDAIQGRVDKETQRVAMRIGESEDIVAETGLYNLTQEEASVLVHFAEESQETYLLVRLPEPEEEEDESSAG